MKLITALGFILFCSSVFSQQVLTFEEVIKRTLEKNYDIRIERNNLQITENNNNIGAAGYLPTVGVNADQNFTSNNTRQQFISGQTTDKKGAKNDALSASIRLNWTIFDGFAMFARDKRLQLQEDLASVNLAARMEMSIYQASVLFYSIQFQEQMQIVFEQAIALSKERFELIQLKVKNGASNDLQLLQAQMDLNTDSSNYLNQANTIKKMKADLALVMGENPALLFDVDPTPPAVIAMQQDKVLENALSQNTNLLIQKSQIAILDQQRKEIQSRYYPQLSIYGQYSLNLSHSQAGFLLSNQSYGPGVGITLSWSILDGLSKVTAVKNNKLQQDNANINTEKQEFSIRSEVSKAWQDYENANRLYALESKTILNTTEMFSIAQKSFENGALTQFELREIQFSIVQAKNRQLLSALNLQTATLNIALLCGDYKKLIP